MTRTDIIVIELEQILLSFERGTASLAHHRFYSQGYEKWIRKSHSPRDHNKKQKQIQEVLRDTCGMWRVGKGG